MKRVLAIALSAAMLVSMMAGCSSNENSTETSTNTTEQTTEAPETTEEEAPAEEEASTDEETSSEIVAPEADVEMQYITVEDASANLESDDYIGDHLVESFTFFGIRSRNALIRIDIDKRPVLPGGDEPCVIIDLRFVAGELLVAVCGYARIAGYAAFCDRRFRRGRKQIPVFSLGSPVFSIARFTASPAATSTGGFNGKRCGIRFGNRTRISRTTVGHGYN